MKGKKSRIFFFSLFHAFKNPFHTVNKILKIRGVVGKMENVVPHTFYSCSNQVRFIVKIIVDGTDRNIAFLSNGSDIDCFPSLFLNQACADT